MFFFLGKFFFVKLCKNKITNLNLHKHFEFRVTHIYLSHHQKTTAVNNPLNVGYMYKLLIYLLLGQRTLCIIVHGISHKCITPTCCDKNIHYLFIANISKCSSSYMTRDTKLKKVCIIMYNILYALKKKIERFSNNLLIIL